MIKFPSLMKRPTVHGQPGQEGMEMMDMTEMTEMTNNMHTVTGSFVRRLTL